MTSPIATDICFMCCQEVRNSQQALSCDICDGWVHRTCDGRMNQSTYRDLNRCIARSDLTCIEWVCQRCKNAPGMIPVDIKYSPIAYM